MRGLVVGGGLCNRGHAVVMVVHQGGYPVFANVGRGKNPEMTHRGVVVINLLFAPVAKNIGLQAGCVLNHIGTGPVFIGHIHQGGSVLRTALPFGNHSALGGFALQIAVPVGAEIHRRTFGRKHRARAVVHIVTGRAPIFVTSRRGIHIGAKAASHIAAGKPTRNNFAGKGIVHFHPV